MSPALSYVIVMINKKLKNGKFVCTLTHIKMIIQCEIYSTKKVKEIVFEGL